ncbi:ATP-grasp domain-containing protein [Jeotgalibacillus proteolyticus]|uniref:Biotin carboxylase n=1 Tax=Jeotgalibacillus proteolyticus TaxID=2082395 RepID=A0A2S5G7P0_9BACL|nr:ATP-grasp domain-containing protein [Jeotgalibacillus proteolyticus]PPA68941.1 biotin carboxylase [Jeotgalibacillus proteolyticus]
MYTIIFIETTKSGSAREAIKAAQRLGYFTILFTRSEKFMNQRKEFPDVCQMIHLKELTEHGIRKEIIDLQQQKKVIKAVVSFMDPYVSLAARIMNELCYSEISVEAFEKMENKAETRKALRKNRATPCYNVFNPKDKLKRFLTQEFTYPLIVKSPVSKASKDVYLVKNKLKLEKEMTKMLNCYPDQNILLEEYLEGPQFIAEVIVHKGEINIVAVLKQHITKKLKFIVTGYALQPKLDENLYKSLSAAVKSIIKDLEVKNAACHIEIRYVKGVWKLIEVNPRISGGAMNRIIEEAYGINLAEEILKVYLGCEPNLTRKHEKNIYAYYLTINSYGRLLKVTGKNMASAQPGVREVHIKPRKGANLMPPISMGHRYGYVIATGNTLKEAQTNATKAADLIKFYLEPL